MAVLDVDITEISSGTVVKYELVIDGKRPSYADVIKLWETDGDFRAFFTNLLADSRFSAFRWETPALSQSSADRSFEFVLINAPHLQSRSADANVFSAYFTNDDQDFGVVSFDNLGGDATMVVPSPQGDKRPYGHLADFVRQAPALQVDALWKVVGRLARSGLSQAPVWINTEGAGVAWLHVRLDTRPKYYGYQPYRQVR